MPHEYSKLTEEALASTILPINSDASAFTSVTASPLEASAADGTPIELKTPLPSSSTCSDQDDESRKTQLEKSSSEPPDTPVAESVEAFRNTSSDILREDSEHHGPQESGRDFATLLDELARSVELEKAQRRRAISARVALHDLTLLCGLDRRLIGTYVIAYGNLIDQYKTDDQAGFTGLYEACEQLRTYCDPSKASADSSASNPLNGSRPLSFRDTSGLSFIHMLSTSGQQNILEFLTRIRTEPDFLSSCISKLSASQLSVLTSSYHPAGIDYSVLQNHSHGRTQLYSKDSQMMTLSRRMDNLHRFHDQDPLFALLYGVFDYSAPRGSQEHRLRTDVWSTTCAASMIQGFTGDRSGSDEFAIAALDAFANFQDWDMTPRMETYLMRIITEGAFLLPSASEQPLDLRKPTEIQNVNAAIAEAHFFENALTDLFHLLTLEPSHKVVPESAMLFVHAILRKIEDPKLRLRAKHFIVCRWYFATFISSILVYPETRGIMLKQHIGETVRRLILQKLVIRLQEQAFDVILPWNNDAMVKPEIREGILTVTESFEPPKLHNPIPLSMTSDNEHGASARFLTLSALDVVGLVQTLYPDKQGASVPQEPTADPASARPSTAGSSTLVAGYSDAGSALVPSSTLSTSGTSITSDDGILEISAANGSPAKGKVFSNSWEAAPEVPSAKDTQKPRVDAIGALQESSRKLKTFVMTSEASGPLPPARAWINIFYSNDSSVVSMTPTLTRDDMSNPSASDQASGDQRIEAHSEDFQTLKDSLVQLLGVSDDLKSGAFSISKGSDALVPETNLDPLENLIDTAMKKARFDLDFSRSYSLWGTLNAYHRYLRSCPSSSFRSLFADIMATLRTGIEKATNTLHFCEVHSRPLEQLQDRQKRTLARLKDQCSVLRVKMWYISDVRHSAAYEEALYVTRALRAMVNPKRTKQQRSTSNWARQRLRGLALHERAETQTLEAMIASKDHGGTSKLADEQVEITSRWLTRNSIENFCKGEEKIHRFSYQMQKSVGKIAGPDLNENPVLWSSNLFKHERTSFNVQRHIPNTPAPFYSFQPAPSASFDYGGPHLSRSVEPNSNTKGLGITKARSPTDSLGALWNTNPMAHMDKMPHPNLDQRNLPPTPTSPPTSWSTQGFAPVPALQSSASPRYLPIVTENVYHSDTQRTLWPERKEFSDGIKTILYSLMLSDLGYLLWNRGSETDQWINVHAHTLQGEKATDEVSGTVDKAQGSGSILSVRGTSGPAEDMDRPPDHDKPATNLEIAATTVDQMAGNLPERNRLDASFPFSEAYSTILQRMSLTADPYLKLQMLSDLENIAIKELLESPSDFKYEHATTHKALQQAHLGLPTTMPRTKATSLEEVIANCAERRAGTLRHSRTKEKSVWPESRSDSAELLVGTDVSVNAFLNIFRHPALRPPTLFRDLQYIAAFVPCETLDHTAQGKAFWDAGLAALALKEDLCESMITRANSITAYHISKSRNPEASTEASIVSSTLQDAADLLLITAREGSPLAARELALFYLTYPELLPRITMALSKAKDVFRPVMINDARSGEKERGALDPLTFAVVFHWMEIAANGGDQDAKAFLRGNGEFSSR